MILLPSFLLFYCLREASAQRFALLALAGVDSACEQNAKRLEARKMLINRAESPASSLSRCSYEVHVVLGGVNNAHRLVIFTLNILPNENSQFRWKDWQTTRLSRCSLLHFLILPYLLIHAIMAFPYKWMQPTHPANLYWE